MPQFTTPSQAAPVNEYLRSRVMSASAEELRLMLLEGALKFARQGRAGLERKDFEASYTGLVNCRDIVMELLTTIRAEPNPELADQVKAVYTFMYTTLVEAGHERDLKRLDSVIDLLEFERETWIMLMRKLAEERGTQQPAAPSAECSPLSIQG